MAFNLIIAMASNLCPLLSQVYSTTHSQSSALIQCPAHVGYGLDSTALHHVELWRCRCGRD